MDLLFAHSIFFFTDPAPTETYTLSLHDALPILKCVAAAALTATALLAPVIELATVSVAVSVWLPAVLRVALDRKSTRLNSSHVSISYAVFCLKKKKITIKPQITIIILHQYTCNL